ncbi:MAG: hypothetical protein U0521_10125 [Anaerolineae bacterium]
MSFAVYTVIVNVAGLPIMGHVWFPLPHWWALILWVAPAVAALGMLVIVMVSSRVRHFTAAQQASGLLVLLIVLLVIGQVSVWSYWRRTGAAARRGHLGDRRDPAVAWRPPVLRAGAHGAYLNHRGLQRAQRIFLSCLCVLCG